MAYYFSDLQRFRREQLNADMTEEEFQQRKNENDRRLKRAFDHIFEKYNRNFDDIGDEIDLENEEIVVNNGHIELMAHNRDDGKRTNHILRSLTCGTGWEGEDETEFEDRSEDESEQDLADGPEDNRAESSVGQNEDESPDTMPSSADDLDNSVAHGEQCDDSDDPLSFEEYAASAKRRRSRLRDTAHPIPTHPIPTLRTSMAKDNVSHAPSNQATTAPSRPEGPQTAAADQSQDDATTPEDDPVERPRKRPRTVLFEIPIFAPQNQMPTTSWDRHWSRKRNPSARAFDEHGNKIPTRREIQEQQQREQNMRPDSVKPNSERNPSTSLTTEVKLEHTCLSDSVASTCLACARDEESRRGTLPDDDRIIDPAVARRLLPEHTCFSGSVAGPCVACERDNETRREDEVDVVGGSTSRTGDSEARCSRDSDGLTGEKITNSPPVDQHGRPSNTSDDRPDPGDDSDEEPDEYDWENNPNIPKPRYITRIIKYYNKRKPFTPEEDRLIIQMYEEQRKNWDDIMEAIRQRSRGQLQYRYYTALRSEDWKEKRAAVADAIKQRKLVEAESVKRQNAAEASAGSLSDSLSEKPTKTPTVRRRSPTTKEEDSEWEERLRSREPTDPAFLSPPEASGQSPDFFATVPPALALSDSNSQTPPNPKQVPAWLRTEPVLSQIERVPMEPVTQLSRPYELLYPEIYPSARIYHDSERPTFDRVSGADSSGDESDDRCENQEATSSNAVHVDLHAPTASQPVMPHAVHLSATEHPTSNDITLPHGVQPQCRHEANSDNIGDGPVAREQGQSQPSSIESLQQHAVQMRSADDLKSTPPDSDHQTVLRSSCSPAPAMPLSSSPSIQTVLNPTESNTNHDLVANAASASASLTATEPTHAAPASPTRNNSRTAPRRIAILKCDNCGFATSNGYWRNAADGRRLCNTCGLYESRTGKPRPVGVRRGRRIPKMNNDKRHSMKALSGREANVLAIATSAPAERIPSSLSPPAESFYDTDGSLEEIDLI